MAMPMEEAMRRPGLVGGHLREHDERDLAGLQCGKSLVRAYDLAAGGKDR